MIGVEEARARVLERFRPLDVVRRPIAEAIGSVLSVDALAPHPLPRFDNSAMDGFAVRAADVASATESSPVHLDVVGAIPAGGAGTIVIEAGTAARIMTGAPVPDGADAVIQIEDVEVRANGIAVSHEVERGTFVRPRGEDVEQGGLLVRAGSEIGPGEAAVLASAGISPVRVHRPPRVAVLITGDELVDPEDEPGPGRIRDSNSVALAGLVKEAGAEILTSMRVPDSLDAHRESFREAASGADLLISSGGVAVGDHDHVKATVEELGRIDLWRVAMQPGKPVVLGEVSGTPFLGLPGNPVSVHVGFEQFVRPAIRKMRGCRALLRPTIVAELTTSIGKRPGRLHLVRVRLEARPDGWKATPTGEQGSHIQTSLVDCHGVARFAPEATRIEAGTPVVVEVWRLPDVASGP